MFVEANNLQMIVIDCPMKYLADTFVRDMFGKLAQLKVEGFDSVNSKYFAFGTNDLLATHFIVAEKDSSGDLTPLISYKGISEADSYHWCVPFDGLDVIEKTNSSEHIQATTNYIEKFKSKGKRLAYSSSLSLSPRVSDKRKKIELIKMFECMAARYIMDFAVDSSICIARVKKKSHLILGRLGYQLLTLDDKELPPVRFPQYANDEFYIMTLDTINQEGKALIETYDLHWRNRIEISEHGNNQSHIYNEDHLDEHKNVS